MSIFGPEFPEFGEPLSKEVSPLDQLRALPTWQQVAVLAASGLGLPTVLETMAGHETDLTGGHTILPSTELPNEG